MARLIQPWVGLTLSSSPSFFHAPRLSIRGTPGLPVLDTHTHSLVINGRISPGMLCWKQLRGAISPGPLVHAGGVGFRALLSLHRESQGSAVGAALPWLDTRFMVTAVKATGCLQPTQGQWPQLSAWSWLLLQKGRIWGERSGWWVDHVLSCRAYCPLLLPPVSAEWHLYQLLPEGVTLAKCHRLQHEWSFFILHFSPCCLLSTPQVPFFFFYFERTLPWNSSAGKSNYIFSSGLFLKKPPNHLWLKHRDYSGWKTLLATALPAPAVGFIPRFSPMLEPMMTAGLIAAVCLGCHCGRAEAPFPGEINRLIQRHPSSNWWAYLESQQGPCDSRTMLVITLPCNSGGYFCRNKNWETSADRRLAFPDLLLFSKF